MIDKTCAYDGGSERNQICVISLLFFMLSTQHLVELLTECLERIKLPYLFRHLAHVLCFSPPFLGDLALGGETIPWPLALQAYIVQYIGGLCRNPLSSK
jgi:hypothetical protein